MLKHLPDGTPLLIRPIRPDDKRLLEQGLHNLSETSVQRRFLSPKPRFSRSELRYLTEVDGRNHAALVAESPAGATRALVGVARYVRLPDDPEVAEVAVVVADNWQRRGVGTALVDELAPRARAQGIRRFTATMASDNTAAHRLMEKLARHSEAHRHGAVSEWVGDLAA
ncbi:MAG TPA: GNAT family N-acetyltransferase [Thermoleophilaceae bacterium]|nr:GNAT family N-acetyltransferase [Thermoleophilaceae bacterium]